MKLAVFVLFLLLPLSQSQLSLESVPDWLKGRPNWLGRDETNDEGKCDVNDRRCGTANLGWIMKKLDGSRCEEICSMTPAVRKQQGYLYGLCGDPFDSTVDNYDGTDPRGPVTYIPGKASVYENGLVLSEGLKSRIIAESGLPVQFDATTDGQTESTDVFHSYPDGAAIFADEETGGWKYVSNAENSEGRGGVGVLSFDFVGRVVGYERILAGTTMNCGGGKTFYNTWLSGEETSDGRVWEIDPWNRVPPRPTVMGQPEHKGYWESAAYDARDPSSPVFYVTADNERTPLLRFRPDPATAKEAQLTGDYSQLLHTPGTNEYLTLNMRKKTFDWTTNYRAASLNAYLFYPNAEGIGTFDSENPAESDVFASHVIFVHRFGTSFPTITDIRDGMMYVTAKKKKELFILNLDCNTFTVSSTETGAFDNQPDQIARLGVGRDEVLYFCEDGPWGSGVHGRDPQGQFFTIVESDDWEVLPAETTGLAFSPDNMRMYVSYQGAGKIFEIKRTDRRAFGGERLDIRYHVDSTNQNPFRA